MFSLICDCDNALVEIDTGSEETIGPYKQMGNCVGLALAWIRQVSDNPVFVYRRPNAHFARSIFYGFYDLAYRCQDDDGFVDIKALIDKKFAFIGMKVKQVQGFHKWRQADSFIGNLEGPAFLFVGLRGSNGSARHANGIYKSKANYIYLFDSNIGVFAGEGRDFPDFIQRKSALERAATGLADDRLEIIDLEPV